MCLWCWGVKVQPAVGREAVPPATCPEGILYVLLFSCASACFWYRVLTPWQGRLWQLPRKPFRGQLMWGGLGIVYSVVYVATPSHDGSEDSYMRHHEEILSQPRPHNAKKLVKRKQLTSYCHKACWQCLQYLGWLNLAANLQAIASGHCILRFGFYMRVWPHQTSVKWVWH